MPGIEWLLQPIMNAAAVVAAWIVGPESANLGVVQMAVAALLLVALVAVATFWRPILTWMRVIKG